MKTIRSMTKGVVAVVHLGLFLQSNVIAEKTSTTKIESKKEWKNNVRGAEGKSATIRSLKGKTANASSGSSGQPQYWNDPWSSNSSGGNPWSSNVANPWSYNNVGNPWASQEQYNTLPGVVGRTSSYPVKGTTTYSKGSSTKGGKKSDKNNNGGSSPWYPPPSNNKPSPPNEKSSIVQVVSSQNGECLSTVVGAPDYTTTPCTQGGSIDQNFELIEPYYVPGVAPVLGSFRLRVATSSSSGNSWSSWGNPGICLLAPSGCTNNDPIEFGSCDNILANFYSSDTGSTFTALGCTPAVFPQPTIFVSTTDSTVGISNPPDFDTTESFYFQSVIQNKWGGWRQ